MKTILLPFSGRDADRAALRLCCTLAEHFGSYVEGLLVLEGPHIVAGGDFGLPAEYLTQATRQWRERADEYRELFARLVRERGIEPQEVTVASDRATAGWHEEQGFESSVVGSYGRLFDLIVIGRHQDASEVGWQSTCEAALFDTGRPALITPPEIEQDFGKSIVVAWNGSTETARTIALGMPFLLRADEVTVLTVEGGTVPGPGGQQVAEHLQRHGIAAKAKSVRKGSDGIGETILHECTSNGADLLFKGAYSHSRLRQVIFGGATREILSSAQIPILMAH